MRAGACVLVVFVEAWLVRGPRPFRIVAALTALRSALSALDGYQRIGGSARCCSAAALGHHRNVALSKRLISIGGSNPRPGLALSSPRRVARVSVRLRLLKEPANTTRASKQLRSQCVARRRRSAKQEAPGAPPGRVLVTRGRRAQGTTKRSHAPRKSENPIRGPRSPRTSNPSHVPSRRGSFQGPRASDSSSP